MHRADIIVASHRLSSCANIPPGVEQVFFFLLSSSDSLSYSFCIHVSLKLNQPLIKSHHWSPIVHQIATQQLYVWSQSAFFCCCCYFKKPSRTQLTSICFNCVSGSMASSIQYNQLVIEMYTRNSLDFLNIYTLKLIHILMHKCMEQKKIVHRDKICRQEKKHST